MATNLIFLGFKGCGKTRIGRIVAQRLGWDFVDLDELLESLYLSEQGEALGFREIYRRHGKDYFRDLEGRALRIALQRGQQILALGGGTLTSNPGLIPLCQAHILLYLVVEPAVLFERIMAGGLPAFFDPSDPQGSFEELYRQRAPLYESVAQYTFDNTSREAEEVAEEIARHLEPILEVDRKPSG